jgi:hypothetical protein
MVAVLLAILGVSLWLVAGMLLGRLYSRHRYRQAPGVFRCKIRRLSHDTEEAQWGRPLVHARWVHDVLLVSRGLALVRFAAVPVAGPDPAEPATVTKLGPAPVVAWFHLDDGTTIVAAANSEDDVRLLGPLPTQCRRPTTADTRTRSAGVYRCGGARREGDPRRAITRSNPPVRGDDRFRIRANHGGHLKAACRQEQG